MSVSNSKQPVWLWVAGTLGGVVLAMGTAGCRSIKVENEIRVDPVRPMNSVIDRVNPPTMTVAVGSHLLDDALLIKDWTVGTITYDSSDPRRDENFAFIARPFDLPPDAARPLQPTAVVGTGPDQRVTLAGQVAALFGGVRASAANQHASAHAVETRFIVINATDGRSFFILLDHAGTESLIVKLKTTGKLVKMIANGDQYVVVSASGTSISDPMPFPAPHNPPSGTDLPQAVVDAVAQLRQEADLREIPK